jgi:nitroreductase
MSDFMELCKQRQSCRVFSERPVEHDKLLQCVEAGRLTPSACNSQPWNFVAVETPEIVSQVAQCCQQLNQNGWVKAAKAFIVIIEEYAVISSFLYSQYYAKGDIGAAAAYICLEAAAQGLGSCIIGLYDRIKICELLNIPVEKQIGAVIALGYPANDIIRAKKRKDFDDIVRFI